MFFSAVKLTSASTTEVDSERQEIKETVVGMKGNAGLTLSFVYSFHCQCLGTSVCSYSICFVVYDCDMQIDADSWSCARCGFSMILFWWSYLLLIEIFMCKIVFAVISCPSFHGTFVVLRFHLNLAPVAAIMP